MSKSNPFKWRHYQAEIILRCVRWYLGYPLSYRQVTEMVNERGMDVHHTTGFRWVQEYGPELDKRCRSYLRITNDSWRVDETYIKIKGSRSIFTEPSIQPGTPWIFSLQLSRDAAVSDERPESRGVEYDD